MQSVAVIGAVGQERLTHTYAVIHVRRRPPIMGLALSQFQADRAAKSIDQGMDFRG